MKNRICRVTLYQVRSNYLCAAPPPPPPPGHYLHRRATAANHSEARRGQETYRLPKGDGSLREVWLVGILYTLDVCSSSDTVQLDRT